MKYFIERLYLQLENINPGYIGRLFLKYWISHLIKFLVNKTSIGTAKPFNKVGLIAIEKDMYALISKWGKMSRWLVKGGSKAYMDLFSTNKHGGEEPP